MNSTTTHCAPLAPWRPPQPSAPRSAAEAQRDGGHGQPLAQVHLEPQGRRGPKPPPQRRRRAGARFGDAAAAVHGRAGEARRRNVRVRQAGRRQELPKHFDAQREAGPAAPRQGLEAHEPRHHAVPQTLGPPRIARSRPAVAREHLPAASPSAACWPLAACRPWSSPPSLDTATAYSSSQTRSPVCPATPFGSGHRGGDSRRCRGICTQGPEWRRRRQR